MVRSFKPKLARGNKPWARWALNKLNSRVKTHFRRWHKYSAIAADWASYNSMPNYKKGRWSRFRPPKLTAQQASHWAKKSYNAYRRSQKGVNSLFGGVFKK